jgi:hypothetical protein
MVDVAAGSGACFALVAAAERGSDNTMFGCNFCIRKSFAWRQAFNIFDRFVNAVIQCGVIAC